MKKPSQMNAEQLRAEGFKWLDRVHKTSGMSGATARRTAAETASAYFAAADSLSAAPAPSTLPPAPVSTETCSRCGGRKWFTTALGLKPCGVCNASAAGGVWS